MLGRLAWVRWSCFPSGPGNQGPWRGVVPRPLVTVKSSVKMPLEDVTSDARQNGTAGHIALLQQNHCGTRSADQVSCTRTRAVGYLARFTSRYMFPASRQRWLRPNALFLFPRAFHIDTAAKQSPPLTAWHAATPTAQLGRYLTRPAGPLTRRPSRTSSTIGVRAAVWTLRTYRAGLNLHGSIYINERYTLPRWPITPRPRRTVQGSAHWIYPDEGICCCPSRAPIAWTHMCRSGNVERCVRLQHRPQHDSPLP